MTVRSVKRKNRFRKRRTQRRGGAETEKECPICMEPMSKDDSTTANCGHKFHGACLNRWCGKLRTCPCPLCRRNVKTGSPARDTTEEDDDDDDDDDAGQYDPFQDDRLLQDDPALDNGLFEADQGNYDERASAFRARLNELALEFNYNMENLVNYLEARRERLRSQLSSREITDHTNERSAPGFAAGLTTLFLFFLVCAFMDHFVLSEEDRVTRGGVGNRSLSKSKKTSSKSSKKSDSLSDMTLQNLLSRVKKQNKCDISSMISRAKTNMNILNNRDARFKNIEQMTVKDIIMLFEKAANKKDKKKLIKTVNAQLKKCTNKIESKNGLEK